MYPTLSDEVSQELAEFIEKAKKYEDKQNNHNFHASKQTLAFNLMVAVEELKQEKLDENFKAFSSYDESYHSCCEIARDIVNGLIEVWGGSTNSTFRDRFRDIYYALKNDKVELITGMSFRKNLVLGKIDPSIILLYFYLCLLHLSNISFQWSLPKWIKQNSIVSLSRKDKS